MLAVMIFLMIILSILLIGAVLLQPGKGDMISGMGSLGGTFTTMFGSSRATNFLTKTTMGLAGAIIVLSLITNLFFVGHNENVAKPVTEGVSVPMQTTPGTQVPAQMPAPAPNGK